MCVCVCVRERERERERENEVAHNSRKLYNMGIISRTPKKMHNIFIKSQAIHTIGMS